MVTITVMQWIQSLKPAGAIHDLMSSNAASLHHYPPPLPALDDEATTTETRVENIDQEISVSSVRPRFKNLIFYNRPPKTGSTSVRIAMKRALDAAGLVSAKCFNRIEWNEMALRTIINRRAVDFYGCHTRLTEERYADLLAIRGHNVTLMTSTRDPSRLILSAYLQEHFRQVNVTDVEEHIDFKLEKSRYTNFVNSYPIDALYAYHGGSVPLKECPVTSEHEAEMRRIAERYEVVVDLGKPRESSAMVELVTGLKPDLGLAENVRVKELTPLLKYLLTLNTSHRTCGNELVHRVLIQQFNLIKDRLLQNDCFTEANDTHTNCDKTELRA